MPALNQQEGTLTGIDKRVNPTNAALPYGGYVLNDIANALGLDAKYTVEYTKQLPEAAGFKAVDFDELPNHYTNSGEEVRGYVMENIAVSSGGDESVKPFDAEAALRSETVYLANQSGGLYVSKAYMEQNSLGEGDRVRVKTAKGELEVAVILDGKIDGMIPYLPTFDASIKSDMLFGGYRFATVSIQKV